VIISAGASLPQIDLSRGAARRRYQALAHSGFSIDMRTSEKSTSFRVSLFCFAVANYHVKSS